jgi:molybdopterin molybdotransferase
MKEHVQVEGAFIRVRQRDAARHIRFRGEDARQGQVLVEAGTVLQPGTLALLASVGHTQPLVTRRPRLLHAVTGNEIVAPEQTPARGQIRDSNSTLVRAWLAALGLEAAHRRLPEDESVALAELQDPSLDVARVDLLLISGGASVGEHDFTRRLFESLGYTVRVSKTTTRPGKPLIVAQRGSTLAFGLPGNPLAHFVCLNLYVRAALAGYSGHAVETAPFQPGVLAADLPAGSNDRETFWPARCRPQAGGALLTPLRWSSSGDLTSLATANALIRVAASQAGMSRGAPVEFLPTVACA